jgi:predicted DNA-binding transcriptional regulator AlpA
MAKEIRERIGLLLPAELAGMLEVTEDTLREWRRTKTGPDFVKVGKSVLYREVDVQQWLEMNVVPTTRSKK